MEVLRGGVTLSILGRKLKAKASDRRELGLRNLEEVSHTVGHSDLSGTLPVESEVGPVTLQTDQTWIGQITSPRIPDFRLQLRFHLGQTLKAPKRGWRRRGGCSYLCVART